MSMLSLPKTLQWIPGINALPHMPTLYSVWSRGVQKKCGLGVFASMILNPQTCLHSDINLFFK